MLCSTKGRCLADVEYLANCIANENKSNIKCSLRQKLDHFKALFYFPHNRACGYFENRMKNFKKCNFFVYF